MLVNQYINSQALLKTTKVLEWLERLEKEALKGHKKK